LILRLLLIFVGWLSIVLGVVGIVLPVLPTTPFILLAAWCFSRSSTRFHHWLHTHPQLGKIVAAWESGEGISVKVRNRVLLLMWLSLLASALIVAKLWLGVVLLLTGSGVSIYLLRLPIEAKPHSDADAD